MSPAQLRKLRGRSLDEWRVRSRQAWSVLTERLSAATELSDAAFLDELWSYARNCSAAGTAALIAERVRRACAADGTLRLRPTFFPSVRQHAEIVATMERRFPHERRAIIERAERALRGRFDLLGFKDLSFGDPIDWRLEPVSGKRTPLAHWSRIDYLNPAVAGDKKITWELNRHAHFVTFGQAYRLTGNERYAEAFVAQAEAWMEANPPQRGINWASSLEVALRSIAWLWAWHLMADAQALVPRFVLRMLKCLIAHGRHIEKYLSHYFSPNTHLTGEALGLLYLGNALRELRSAARWSELGFRILLEQAQAQVRADGVYFEQASYYHRYTADFYLHVAALLRARERALPDGVEARLVGLLDHLMWLTRPDGTTPLIGDDDGGRLISFSERQANDFRDTLATGAALFGRRDWKHVAGEATVETLWLLGPQGLEAYDRLEPVPPRERSRAFAEGGYYVMRDGWTPQSGSVLVDCGPHGAGNGGHAHADALSFEFTAAGRTWLIDPGTFTYTGDAEARDVFRHTRAHNTVTVDGEAQSLAAGTFAWRQTARCETESFFDGGSVVYFRGSHDGYERLPDPVKHTRALLFVRPDALRRRPLYLIVRDSFTAVARHRYELRFHFPADCEAAVSHDRVIATAPDGRQLLIAVIGSGELHAMVEEGFVSSCYGQRERAPVAVFTAVSTGPQEFVTFIVPLEQRGVPELKLSDGEVE
ncbi:MAG TPA: alginate lyase family protein [Blastocatellia bacterium]|nr:alginate lyase family protein [Blastocatellia bacterium]